MLVEEAEIPAGCNEPDELMEKAFDLVPGSEQVLNKYTRIHDNLMKGGQVNLLVSNFSRKRDNIKLWQRNQTIMTF